MVGVYGQHIPHLFFVSPLWTQIDEGEYMRGLNSKIRYIPKRIIGLRKRSINKKKRERDDSAPHLGGKNTIDIVCLAMGLFGIT